MGEPAGEAKSKDLGSPKGLISISSTEGPRTSIKITTLSLHASHKRKNRGGQEIGENPRRKPGETKVPSFIRAPESAQENHEKTLGPPKMTENLGGSLIQKRPSICANLDSIPPEPTSGGRARSDQGGHGTKRRGRRSGCGSRSSSRQKITAPRVGAKGRRPAVRATGDYEEGAQRQALAKHALQHLSPVKYRVTPKHKKNWIGRKARAKKRPGIWQFTRGATRKKISRKQRGRDLRWELSRIQAEEEGRAQSDTASFSGKLFVSVRIRDSATAKETEGSCFTRKKPKGFGNSHTMIFVI